MMKLPKMSIISLALIFSLATTCCRAQNSQQDYLNAHNTACKAVGVGNMTWSATLATYATNYVKTKLSSCSLVHSGGPYGENLAKGTGTFSGVAAVKMWTDEKSCYNYASNECISSTSCPYGCYHYTQVVWSDSVRLGCARLQCSNGWWFVSCNYDPPGNYEGETPY